MQTKKYIGPRGVETVVIEEMKTWGGAEVVTVHYDGGYKELMTKKTFELVMTEEPSDFTSVRNKKFFEMSKEMYSLLATYIAAIGEKPEEKSLARTSFLENSIAMITEYDLKVAEVEPFLNPILTEATSALNAVSYEIDNTFNRATSFLWTKDDSNFVPGTDMMMDRTLLEAKKINSEIPAPAPSNAAAPVDEAKAEEAAPEDGDEPTPAK